MAPRSTSTGAGLLRAATLIALLCAATICRADDHGVVFLYPTKGLTLNYLDTINVQWTSPFPRPNLYTFCSINNSAKQISQFPVPTNGTWPVLLNFTASPTCWFNLRPGFETGFGANSQNFALLADQRSTPTTAGLSSESTTSSTSSSTSSSTDQSTTPQPTPTDDAAAAADSPSDTPTPTPSSAPPPARHGLSAGASAGIGVGVAIGVIGLVGAVGAFLWRRRKQRREAAASSAAGPDEKGNSRDEPASAFGPPGELPAKEPDWAPQSAAPGYSPSGYGTYQTHGELDAGKMPQELAAGTRAQELPA